MRRRAESIALESTSPARVLLASGERDGDGAGSPSCRRPRRRRRRRRRRRVAFAVDAADAAALVADLVVARADADLADVLATSLTVAIEVEESGAREAGGVGDGERWAVLCELVLDRTNGARGSARRWRPTAPHCTATRVVDETADEATDRADVLRVEASLSPRRHPAVRLAAVTLRGRRLVGAKPAASTNPSLRPSRRRRARRPRRRRRHRRGRRRARAGVARARREVRGGRAPGDGRGVRPEGSLFLLSRRNRAIGLVVAVVDDARLRGCCAATRVYTPRSARARWTCSTWHPTWHPTWYPPEEGPFTRDDESDDAGLNGVPLAFPPLGSVAAEDRTLAIALHRLCAASDAPADSCARRTRG